MTPSDAFRKRMALSRSIRAVLAETLPDVQARVRWLRMEGAQIEREAERAARPLEHFPIDPQSPEAML